MADALRPDEPLATVRGFPAQTGPLDLELRRGDVVHLRGGNGCGKTSLLRALAGLESAMRPESVTVLGDDPAGLAAPELARRVRAAWSTPRAGLVGLTVQGEARLRGVPLPADLAGLAGRDVATLSAGEARKVALAFVAASPAPLLLLDEPATGLDADGLARLDALVAAARAGAVAIADHTGWAAKHATRTVQLGPPDAAVFTPPAAPAGPAVLQAPPCLARRGRTTMRLPAVELGPGLHAATGRNGAGKTTLLRRLAGLEDSDDVAVGGTPPAPGANVRLLQADAGDLLMGATVADELRGSHDAEGFVPASLLGRHPLSLSAGEAQRVALAKALGRPAPVHLLDEPEAHLDADGRRRLAAAIARRVAAGACVLVASHDLGLVAAARSRVEVGA